MKKSIYLGVDQTGAVNIHGQPRPLPACFIRNNTVSFFYLRQFSKIEILNQIQPVSREEILICVDCALGLPPQIQLTWRQALKQIHKYDGYGRLVARNYFADLGHGQIPRREIEIACGANSVFTEKPYQKNIQTGTFRIWKDLSFEENQFYAPALEPSARRGALKIFEGYPSLSWKILLNSPTRQPSRMSELLRRQFPKILFSKKQQSLVEKDPNLADALLLALTIQKFKKSALSQKPCDQGWILGYKKE